MKDKRWQESKNKVHCLAFPVKPATANALYAKWAGKRLPAEAEWEYASRGGLENKNFPWGDQIDPAKVNYGKKYKSALKVGTFNPDGLRLFDISGEAAGILEQCVLKLITGMGYPRVG